MYDDLMALVDKWSDGTPEDRVATLQLFTTLALDCAQRELRRAKDNR